MTPASTPYPAHRLPDGPRCKSRLCIAHRSRFLESDTRLHEESAGRSWRIALIANLLVMC